jgi:hypothetical protein
LRRKPLTGIGGVIHFQIEHQCPQCGAPATLEETERLFSCPFCRVKSYLLAPDHFRYLLPAQSADDPKLVYFPYWRFKGMLFSSLAAGVRTKFIDVSRQAVRSTHIPITVGFRSQALKLRFVTPETGGRFISPTTTLDEMVAGLKSQFCGTLPKPILHHAHVGESTSLLYAPFFLRDRLYDAILDTPVRSPSGDQIDLNAFETENGHGALLFVTTLCPNCGWDLEGAADSLVLHCKNCVSAWYPAGRKLKPLKFGVIQERGEDILYLPFWRIRSDITGIDLATYADLVKIANLPRVVRSADKSEPFRFWVPAFKVRPNVFLRLAENMTLGRRLSGLKTALPLPPYHSVTLPVTEALEGLKTILAAFYTPRHRVREVVPDIEVRARSFTLVYVPFREGHHEYIQTGHQFAITKNTLALSGNL